MEIVCCIMILFYIVYLFILCYYDYQGCYFKMLLYDMKIECLLLIVFFIIIKDF